MKKVLTAEQMREVDRITIEAGIPGIILMENAARACLDVAREAYSFQRDFVVFCGKGNNGGDGLAIARQLKTAARARSVEVYLLFPPEELQGDAALNFRMLQAAGVPFQVGLPQKGTDAVAFDALFGTGYRVFSGRYEQAFERTNQYRNVVAVDIPSGIPSNGAGSANIPHVRAEHTVTFTAPKPAHVLPPFCHKMGRIHVVEIGSREEWLPDGLRLLEASDIASLLALRARDGHKGTYGHVLVIAGSRDKPGAAALSGLAALRSGAGLVTVATAASAAHAVIGVAPELMVVPLPEESDGSLGPSAKSRIHEALSKVDVVAMGPGMGTGAGTVALVRELYQQVPLPMVVDADGLNALGTEALSGAGLRVLTPHPAEMARLLGSDTKSVLNDRVNIARQYAGERDVVLLLKGDRTLIAQADGTVWINPTGTPAMGTAGSGDVLTGMIAGLLGQARDPMQAVLGAAYLHGLAGEEAARELGEQPVIASDLLRYLPGAMHVVRGHA